MRKEYPQRGDIVKSKYSREDIYPRTLSSGSELSPYFKKKKNILACVHNRQGYSIEQEYCVSSICIEIWHLFPLKRGRKLYMLLMSEY